MTKERTGSSNPPVAASEVATRLEATRTSAVLRVKEIWVKLLRLAVVPLVATTARMVHFVR
jgi:hypothetical protein